MLFLGIWEWACVASAATTFKIVEWSLINTAVGLLMYARTRKMGVVPYPSCLVLRYFLFRRSIAWSDVDRLDLCPYRSGRVICVYRTDGSKVTAPTSMLFGAPGRGDSWRSPQRLVWRGGESTDIVGTLNDMARDHKNAKTEALAAFSQTAAAHMR